MGRPTNLVQSATLVDRIVKLRARLGPPVQWPVRPAQPAPASVHYPTVKKTRD